jgi:hypothetical protein
MFCGFDVDVDVYVFAVDFDVPVLKRPPVFGDVKFRLFEILHPRKLSWGDSRGGFSLAGRYGAEPRPQKKTLILKILILFF